jgi:hypothetical protein
MERPSPFLSIAAHQAARSSPVVGIVLDDPARAENLHQFSERHVILDHLLLSVLGDPERLLLRLPPDCFLSD